MNAIPKIVELMSKMRRSNSRTLRKNYADQAKALLKSPKKKLIKQILLRELDFDELEMN